MRTFLILAPLLLCTLSACQSASEVPFEAAGPDGEMGRSARYMLASAEGTEGSIVVEAWGVRNDELDGRTTDTLRVLFSVDNLSDDPIVLPALAAGADDDQGRHYEPVQALLPEGSGEGQLSVPARGRASGEILFDLGGTQALRSLGSFVVGWLYRFRGSGFPHATRFLPVRVVYRPVYAGGGSGHPFQFRGWYGGWYGGFWCW